MAKQVLTFTEGEFGFNYTFHAFNEDATAANLTAFTGVRLIILNESTGLAELDITSNLTITSPDIVWALQDGQTDYNGEFLAVLHLTATGVLEKTFQFACVVTKKLI